MFGSGYNDGGQQAGQTQTQSCMCNKCGGLIMRENTIYGWSGKICQCSIVRNNLVNRTAGWICPRCNSSNNPLKDKCDCK